MKRFHDELIKTDNPSSAITLLIPGDERLVLAVHSIKQISFENGFLEINYTYEVVDGEILTLAVLKYKDIIGFKISTRTHEES